MTNGKCQINTQQMLIECIYNIYAILVPELLDRIIGINLYFPHFPDDKA